MKTLYEYNAINITLGYRLLSVSDLGPNEKMLKKPFDQASLMSQ